MVDLTKMLGGNDPELNRVQAKGNLARTKRDYLVACASLKRAKGRLGEKTPDFKARR